MTGTIIAQAIPVAISPILTRLYTPEDFGVLALFIAIASAFSVIATLRYHLAIVQAHHTKDAISLVFLSAFIGAVVSLISLVAIYFFNEEIQSFFTNKEIGKWLYLVPISIFLSGLYQSLNFWLTRKKVFKTIAFSKMNQGVGSSAVQIALGGGAFGALGLISGYIIGQVVSLATLLKNGFSIRNEFTLLRKERIKENAIKYQAMPKYSAPGTLADNLSVQMPIFILSKYYDMAVTGIFSLTFRILNIPLSLVSGALHQVLLQRLASISNISPFKTMLFILKLFLVLLITMVPLVIFMWFYGEAFFAFVFGEAWREAGAMAKILVFAVAIRFAVSPLSAVLALERNIKIGVFWQFTYLFTISTVLIYFSSYPISDFIRAFVIHEIILYLLYFALILKGVNKMLVG